AVKALRVLYHMARADFLERTRPYFFLSFELKLVLWVAKSLSIHQPANTAQVDSPETINLFHIFRC
ncbi:MAG: hypothetical protein ACU83O_13985, partial [Gammaproteobacteria bacterium]